MIEINPNHDVNLIMGRDSRYPTLGLERVTYKRPRKAVNFVYPHHGTCKIYAVCDLIVEIYRSFGTHTTLITPSSRHKVVFTRSSMRSKP